MITDTLVEEMALGLLRADPWQLVVPAKVYRELERQAECAGCVPNIVDIIIATTGKFHLEQNRSQADFVDVRAKLQSLRQKRIGGRGERRSTGYRAA